MAWPARLEYGDPASELEVTCRVGRVRFAPTIDDDRLVLRLPAGATRLDRHDLKRALERLGAM